MHASTGLGLVANVLMNLGGWDIVLELAPRNQSSRSAFFSARLTLSLIRPLSVNSRSKFMSPLTELEEDEHAGSETSTSHSSSDEVMILLDRPLSPTPQVELADGPSVASPSASQSADAAALIVARRRIKRLKERLHQEQMERDEAVQRGVRDALERIQAGEFDGVKEEQV